MIGYCLTVFICPYYLYRAQWSIAIGYERQHVKFILCEFPKASNTSAKIRVASDGFSNEWIICVLNFVKKLLLFLVWILQMAIAKRRTHL